MKLALNALVFVSILLSSAVSQAEFAQTDVHLFDRRNFLASRRTPEQLRTENLATLEKLGNLPVATFEEAALYNQVPSVSLEQANELLNSTMDNPVATSSRHDEYDPTGAIGFCFGRAMTAHLEAIYRGVMKESIKKLWVVGDLKDPSTNWAFHVTTIVRGPDNVWYTIDPIMSRVLTVEQWYERISRTYDSNNDGQLVFFITDAIKFGPTAGAYYRGSFRPGFYNQYFSDLLKHFRSKGPSGPRFAPLPVPR